MARAVVGACVAIAGLASKPGIALALPRVAITRSPPGALHQRVRNCRRRGYVCPSLARGTGPGGTVRSPIERDVGGRTPSLIAYAGARRRLAVPMAIAIVVHGAVT